VRLVTAKTFPPSEQYTAHMHFVSFCAVRSASSVRWCSSSAIGIVKSNRATVIPNRYGRADDTRHVIGCHLTPETKLHIALVDMAGNTCQGRAGTARHVIGRLLAQETRVYMRWMTWRAVSVRPHGTQQARELLHGVGERAADGADHLREEGRRAGSGGRSGSSGRRREPSAHGGSEQTAAPPQL
jgi:hypothetical protein